jgi:L-amino acid N-acyltransferase YncA
VLGDDRGFVTIGHGLVDRIEMSAELLDRAHGNGAGRQLIRDGLRSVGVDELVFAQVAPGNAASLRAFLKCDFVPIGSEVLIDVSSGGT